MEFKKYSSLENSYRTGFLQKIVDQGLDGGDWVVTEKVHGANFSFWCDGDTVKVARRSGFTDGTFYNCQPVIDKYKDKVLDLFNYCCSTGDILVIYGELYGEGVQKGVFYSKEKDFVAFDVNLNGVFLDKDFVNSVVTLFNIPVAPVLYKGSFLDCLDFNNTFDSKVGGIKNNTAEGVVIAPNHTKYLANGSRVIIKNKTSSFSEKAKKVKTKKPDIILTEDQQELYNTLTPYLCENRLKNVISKIGAVTNKDFGKLQGLLVQDAQQDYAKDYEVDLQQCDIFKSLKKQLHKEAANVVRANFLNIIDGEF